MSRSPLEVDPVREEQELRDYLGAEFELERLRNYERTLSSEFEAIGDEARLYRTSRAYLYNLTAFAMTGTKTPYLRELERHLPRGARILDYGCGIGSDGLLLAEAGYLVDFADFDNPSTEYLRWRLKRRGIEAPVHDIDRDVPGGFDCAFAFDVVEHVDDPVRFLEEMESRAELVMVNFLESETDDQPLHRDLPVRELVDRAALGRLHSYRIYHGRSHLVLYRREPAGSLRRMGQKVKVALTRQTHARRR